jgi:hypothetical protein
VLRDCEGAQPAVHAGAGLVLHAAARGSYVRGVRGRRHGGIHTARARVRGRREGGGRAARRGAHLGLCYVGVVQGGVFSRGGGGPVTAQKRVRGGGAGARGGAPEDREASSRAVAAREARARRRRRRGAALGQAWGGGLAGGAARRAGSSGGVRGPLAAYRNVARKSGRGARGPGARAGWRLARGWSRGHSAVGGGPRGRGARGAAPRRAPARPALRGGGRRGWVGSCQRRRSPWRAVFKS